MEPDLISNHTTPLTLTIGEKPDIDSPRGDITQHSREVISSCKNEFPQQVIVTRLNDQMKELQTNIRDQ